MEKDVFLICKVRGVEKGSEEYRRQQIYVESLESQGIKVHWPHRDTKQNDPERGTGICRATFWAIYHAKEVHVMFDPTSEGFVADMMMTFALNELGKHVPFSRFVRRRMVVIVNPDAVEEKIRQEVEQQIAKGVDPGLAKSYTMVLKNLADETVTQ